MSSFRLLDLGESLRENPKTIYFSIPVLVISILWYWINKNSEGIAGGFGHLGITFMLLYKHRFQNKLLLRIAYRLFYRSSLYSISSSQPTVLLKMAQIKAEQGDLNQAKKDIESALKYCRQIKDLSQSAYIEAHLGRIKTKLGEFNSAKKNLDDSLRVLKNFSNQIWTSTAEIGLSEWYLSQNDKKKSLFWATKAKLRADKYSLKTRKLDVGRLLDKIQNE